MNYIDKYAYFSGLKDVSSEYKISFSLISLLCSVLSKSIFAHIFIFSITSLLLLTKGNIPIRYYLKLLLLPMSFILLSTLGIILNISTTQATSEYILQLFVSRIYFYILEENIIFAFKLSLKAICSVSCLYFLILTTPVPLLTSFLSRLKVPQIILILLTLIYRFIFILTDISITKIRSQQARFGFMKAKGTFKNIGMLWASVFIQSMLKSEWIYKSMKARGYEGELKFLDKSTRLTIEQIVSLMIIVTIVVILNTF